jgi:hypothetical protein
MNLLQLLKVLLLSIAVSLPFSVNAELIKLPDSPIGRNYLELPVISKSNNLVQVWLLQDFFERQNGALSMRAINEIDCNKDLIRVLRIQVFLSSMAKSELADFENPERNRGWYPITIPSFADNAKKIVCIK